VSGYHFTYSALDYQELEQAIAWREVDFVLTNPSHYVLMTYRNGLSSPLATLVPMDGANPVTGFGGVIITRAGRDDLTRLADLRGHTVASVFRGSLGGYQAQATELLRAGLRLPQDLRLLETGMPHDAVVAAVLSGQADAGFIRTGLLEALAAEGRLDLKQVRVLNPQRVSGFPFLLSTRLYPEWPLAALPHADADLARRVAAALLALPHDGAVARELAIHGFNIPQDYEPVRAMLQALRLPPFEAAPEFTAHDVWHKYSWEVLAATLMGGVILLLTARLLLLNRRLGLERQRVAQQSEERRRLLAAVGEGVYGVDRYGFCTFVNPAALEMLGLTAEEVVGADQHALFHHHHEDGTAYPVTECPVYLTLRDGQARHMDEWFLRRDGSGFPVLLTVAPVSGADGQDGAVVVFRDMAERRHLETELRTQASTDALTGLSNRRYFLAEMERELGRVRRTPELPAAVLMVDLDNFKGVNDRYGHAAGDVVLRHFATTLALSLRGSDLVGRLGGEEFAVLLPGSSLEHGGRLAERLRRLVAGAAVTVDDVSVCYTVSIGVTRMVAADATVDRVLARADTALYRAKDAGRDRVASEPPPA
jgi:diguanylate cyclase (GGDEF)-like protein/PAS domain S-box-containing protein